MKAAHWAIMTAYNRLNGRWLTEQPEMLSDLLRGEWGFEGLVMTDWFAVADTDAVSSGPASTSRCPDPDGRSALPSSPPSPMDASRGRISMPPCGGSSTPTTGSARWTDRHRT